MIAAFVCTYLYAGVSSTVLFKGWQHSGLTDYLDSLVGVLIWPLIIPLAAWRGDLPK